MLVPFGKRHLVGVVLEDVDRSAIAPGRLKNIIRALPGGRLSAEDLRLLLLSGRTVDDRHRLASVVDEHLVARDVVLAQHDVLAAQPAPVLIAEDAVLPAVRLLGLVLLPQ